MWKRYLVPWDAECRLKRHVRDAHLYKFKENMVNCSEDQSERLH